MSLYDDASLIMYPSGYKADKIYSLKPTDGSGDLTFARASTATRVNADGLIESVATGVPRIDYTGGGCGKLLIEPQRTNLITYSEDFADAYWTKTNSSIVSNVGVSPDGTTTADRLVPDTSLATKHLIYKSSQSIECYSLFAKADGFNWLLLTSHSSTAPTARGTFFDLENGVIGEKGNGQTAWMEDYGNGWWKCSIDGGSSSSSIYAAFCCEVDDNANIAAPNGTDGIQIWGAENQDGVYPTSYIPTSGATVTRVRDDSSTTSLPITTTNNGTFYAEISDLEPGDGSENLISLYQGGTLKFLIRNFDSDITKFRFFDGTRSSYMTGGVNGNSGLNKVSLSWEGTTILRVSVNGSSVAINNLFLTSFTLDRLDIEPSNAKYNLSGVITKDTSMTEAELNALTTL